MKFPSEVIQAREYFLQNPSHELFEIANKLIIHPADEIEMARMWVSYLSKLPESTIKISAATLKKLEVLRQKHEALRPKASMPPPISGPVYGLLEHVNELMVDPAYQNKSKKDRLELAGEIGRLTERLAFLLEVNQVDFRRVINDNRQQYFVCDPIKKINVPDLIRNIGDEASGRVGTEDTARSGQNASAIRFVRRFVRINQLVYERTFASRVATITNAVYGTDYTKVNITQLVNRRGGKTT